MPGLAMSRGCRPGGGAFPRGITFLTVGADGCLARQERAWRWGLVLLTDAESRELLPTETGSDAVVGCETAMVCRIRHAVDGSALAEVCRDFTPSGLVVVHSLTIFFPSAGMRLGDAGGELVEEAAVAEGPWLASVYVDEIEHPEDVVISLASGP